MLDKQERDVLKILLKKPFINQRLLAEQSKMSLGSANYALRSLVEQELLDSDYAPTASARQLAEACSPKRAVILAAGFGMRMVPINLECPKGLLEVRGEPLIERIIRQLHEVGITDISVVVGFLKEQYEYLIDEYGIRLIVNSDYATKNNLHSLALAAKHLENAYIIPCDLWCADNPFDRCELASWYLVSEETDPDSTVRVNRKNELVSVSGRDTGNCMLGIAYLTGDMAEAITKRLIAMDGKRGYEDDFWEAALLENGRMLVEARVAAPDTVVEINTYEQLRELDNDSNQLKSDAIAVIAEAMGVKEADITGITVLKKGMTNRSFLFRCDGKQYIMRIPGEGTDRLINRREEAAVYHAIANHGLCDDVVYINPENGYKITAFLENARVCDSENDEDLRICMDRLRSFHGLKLQVPHTFDVFGQIRFYEQLWEGAPSVYRDYLKTKERVFSLQRFIEEAKPEYCLTHIDAVPDNFLLLAGENGTQDIRLIDWEYAGMQDPYVDVAMFCIYSLYERPQVDHLIDLYFEGNCPPEIRARIYCYIAACGLLWSNWCEYKRSLGVDFGEYSLRQYRYAKDYYKIAMEAIEKLKTGDDTACIQ